MLDGLLKTKEVTLDWLPEPITIIELPYQGFCETREASNAGDEGKAGGLTIWWGCPEMREYAPEDIATKLSPAQLDELANLILDLSGGEDLDQEQIEGNSEAGQNAA